MKKFGYFLLVFVPLVLVLIIQNIASLYAVVVAMTISILQGENPLSIFINPNSSILMDTDFNGMIMIIYVLISICIFGLWYYFRYEGDYLPLFHHKFQSRKIISIIGIVIIIPGAQFAATLICGASAILMPKAYDAYVELMETAGMAEQMTVIIFIYSVILAPICEELIFRGVTMSCAKRLFKFWPANIIQAILFGVFHMNLIQGIYAFALGLLLGYVCEKGKSIYFSLLLHFLFNFWAATMTLIFSVEEAEWLEIGIYPITIVSLVAGMILFKAGLLDSKKNAEAQEAY